MFEISPSPQTPSNAVDNLIYVQETIKTIASKLNFHATFHPEAFDKSNTVAQTRLPLDQRSGRSVE